MIKVKSAGTSPAFSVWALLLGVFMIIVSPVFGNTNNAATINDDTRATSTAPANINDDSVALTFKNGAIPSGGVGMTSLDANSITSTNIAGNTVNSLTITNGYSAIGTTFANIKHGAGNVTINGTNKGIISASSFAAVNNTGTFAGKNNTTLLAGFNRITTGTGTGASSYGYNSVVVKPFNDVNGSRIPAALVTRGLTGFNLRF